MPSQRSITPMIRLPGEECSFSSPHASHLSITGHHRPDVEKRIDRGLTMDGTLKMRKEDNGWLIQEHPRALPYPLWFGLRGVEWDWSLCARNQSEESVSHETHGGELQISGWEVLTKMRAITSVRW